MSEKHICLYCEREFATERGVTVHMSRWCSYAGCPICEGGVGQACWSHFL